MNQYGFISRDVSFLLKEKEVLFGSYKICLVARRAISCSLMINLTNSLRTRPQRVAISPILGMVLKL